MIGAALKKTHGGHRNSPSEAHIYIGAIISLTVVVIAVVEKPRVFFVPVAQRERVWIERAEDDFRVRVAVAEVRQVDIVEEARFDAAAH